MKFLSVGLGLICSIMFSVQTMAATASRVIDGDTLVVSDDGKEFKCRMACIDAPEMSQPYGPDSKNHLQELVNGQTITVTDRRRDFYGRTLGMVLLPDSTNINLLMVSDGYAWAYKRKRGIYHDAQLQASFLKCGLWEGKDPEAPWVYRKRRKNHRFVGDFSSAEKRGAMLRDATRTLPDDLGIA